MNRIGMDAPTVAKLASAILQRTGRPYLGTKATLRPMPVGSSRTKTGAVHLSRGSMEGLLTPDEARAMGPAWLEAAEATSQDTLFDGVLRRADWLSHHDLEALFGVLQDMRAGTTRQS